VTGVDQHNDSRAAARATGVAWRRRSRLSIAGILGVAALTACGASSSSKATAPAAASSAAGGTTSSTAGSPQPTAGSASSASVSSQPDARPASITIDKFAYQVPASVSPGAMVTVLNKDGEAHTVTADSGAAFDDKASPGASTSFTAPMKPGSYPFHCTYHSNMHGVLVVK